MELLQRFLHRRRYLDLAVRMLAGRWPGDQDGDDLRHKQPLPELPYQVPLYNDGHRLSGADRKALMALFQGTASGHLVDVFKKLGGTHARVYIYIYIHIYHKRWHRTEQRGGRGVGVEDC